MEHVHKALLPCLLSLSVFESFIDYVAVEQLDGDNKYDAGEHGLQVMLSLQSGLWDCKRC